jgi:ABC-type sugar transport system substrate-binding protein/AraC-like DNA-binding protein
MKRKYCFCLLILFAFVLTACKPQVKRYRIGFSQCTSDVWRDKLSKEVELAAYYYDNADVECTFAHDDDQLQMQQVQNFIDEGVDLIIVSPNQIQRVTSVINEAYDKGIPVILFDKNTNGRYTAFIGADNMEMGKTMGMFVAQQLKHKGNVLEVTGISQSNPTVARAKGFEKAIAPYKDIRIVGTVQSDWSTNDAYLKVKKYLQKNDVHVDYVFAQNDRMAAGARKAFLELGKGAGVRFCGIDGLSSPGGGLELVRDGILEATYVNPTRGDMVMKLAMDILEHRPYRKYTKLSSALVTREMAPLMLMQAEELESQLNRIQEFHDKLAFYLVQYSHQKVYLLFCGIILVLLVAFFVFFYRTMLFKHKVAEKMITDKLQHYMQLTQIKELQDSAADSADDSTAVPVTGNVKQQTDSEFMNRIFDCIMAHLSDPDFNVQILAQELNMSRVQLYRKVKADTGSTLVDMVKITRLQQADQLLQQGGKTIAEISYEVGFSSPSYFSKCYKEYFGHLPTEKV